MVLTTGTGTSEMGGAGTVAAPAGTTTAGMLARAVGPGTVAMETSTVVVVGKAAHDGGSRWACSPVASVTSIADEPTALHDSVKSARPWASLRRCSSTAGCSTPKGVSETPTPLSGAIPASPSGPTAVVLS